MDMSLSPIAFIEGIGGPEMGLILVITLLLFGGKKLPEFAKGLGKSIREFKKAAGGVEQEFKRALEEEPPKPYTPPPSIETTPDHTTGNEYHDYHHDESHAYNHEAGPTEPAVAETPPGVPGTDAATAAPSEPDISKTETPKSDLTPPTAVTTPPPPPKPPVTP